MKRFDELTNQEIAELVLFETKDSAEKILRERFPEAEFHHIHVFSNGDCDIQMNNRHIVVKSADYEQE